MWSLKVYQKALMKPVLLITFFVTCLCSSAQQKDLTLEIPEWSGDLIIYELSPKSFTSPNGPGTGTFKSSIEKIRYLADLGITGIWLTGHNWADKNHFYGIWTQYAVIRPDSIEPSLGTRADLKAFTDLCHSFNIKVFLDIITHGIMSYSPLITEHPEWFKGGSWGMTDYDWNGKHSDLDKWWVKTHTGYVKQCGIDGYRLDVAISRIDLWKQIKKECAGFGHPIVVWNELETYSEGLCDFFQRQTTLSVQESGLDKNNPLNYNATEYFEKFKRKPAFYFAKIFYADGSISIGNTWNEKYFTDNIINESGQLKRRKLYRDLKIDVINEYMSANKTELIPNNVKNIFRLSNVKTDQAINTISITGSNNRDEIWRLDNQTPHRIGLKTGDTLLLELDPVIPEIALFSIQISSHDDGWESFPADANPYVSEGSRCTFGYSCMFLPAIPIFMSGEEFDADYIPLPLHTPDLYGKGEKGKGRWLYGSWIQWDQLKEPGHAQMLEDVKKMILLRKKYSKLLRAEDNSIPVNISALKSRSTKNIPVPYIIGKDNQAMIVAGNNTNEDISLTIDIPHDILNFKPQFVNDVWNNKKLKVENGQIKLNIKRDNSPGGGLAVIVIEK
jgi:glycosidase